MTDAPLLEVQDLHVEFPIRSTLLRRKIGSTSAVNGVSFTLDAGESLGLVGESGSGKSTTALAVLRLTEATSGRILYRGTDLSELSPRRMRRFRREIQVVLQNPASALDSRMTVGDILAEPLRIHRIGDRSTHRDRVVELLRLVGLREDHVDRYPHQFSGGQQQRIAIARALAVEPSLLILDEPTSALDVSIQAQIINLLSDLQRDLGLAYLFIAHDLGVVRHLSRRVAVMYWGNAVEYGDIEEVYERPAHPYTRALMSAVPIDDPDQRGATLRELRGDTVTSATPPPGCRFQDRCPLVEDVCRTDAPRLLPVATAGHVAACHVTARAVE